MVARMLVWLVEAHRALRDIRLKTMDALAAYAEGDEASVPHIQRYISADLDRLLHLLEGKVSGKALNDLRRHAAFAEEVDFRDIISRDLPSLEAAIESFALERREVEGARAHVSQVGFANLLHPTIVEKAVPQYWDGHLRDAVLNSVIAVFDQIRERTGLDLDGDGLVTRALSVHNPQLVLSEVETESGRNDQVGFMKILQGAFQGVRNPKAHSVRHDLTEVKAGQYLVFASLLARRIEEARLRPETTPGGVGEE